MGQAAPSRTLIEDVAEFLSRGPSAEEIAHYRMSEHAQGRVRALIDKNAEGTLTPDETTELDEITVLDQLFTLIRARLADHAHNGHSA